MTYYLRGQLFLKAYQISTFPILIGSHLYMVWNIFKLKDFEILRILKTYSNIFIISMNMLHKYKVYVKYRRFFRWLLYNLYPTSNNSPPSPFLFSQREKSLNFYRKSLRWWNSVSQWLWVHWPKSLTKKVDDFPHLRIKIHQIQWLSVNDFDLGGSFETG